MDYQDLIGLVLVPTPKSELQQTVEEIEQFEYRKAMGISLIRNDRIEPRRPNGRPPVVTKEVIRDLRQAFMIGCSVDEAVAFAGIAKQTYYNYTAKNPEFLDYVTQWKEEPILKAKMALFDSLTNGDMALRYLERKKRDEFALRKELTGPDGGSIALTLDRLDTDYGTVADRAKERLGSALTGQVVEDDPPIQDQDQGRGT